MEALCKAVKVPGLAEYGVSEVQAWVVAAFPLSCVCHITLCVYACFVFFIDQGDFPKIIEKSAKSSR